jgi:glucose/arabinose dehydrogenase
VLATLAATAAMTVAAIPFPTNIDFDPAGGMWVTSGAGAAQSSDGVWYLPRGAKHPRHVASGLHTALGLRWYGGRLYVGHVVSPSRGRVTALSGFDGKRFTKRAVILPRLRIGRHTVDSIVADPAGGRLLVGVGSVADHSGPPGRVLSFKPDGSDVRTEATGLRNPYGLAFIPGTRRLLITDNARDDLGLRHPADELNLADLSAAATPRFGFPRCDHPPCRAPLVKLPPHASTDGLAVKPGPDGTTIAYVAEYGSSFAANPTGRDVRRITLTPRGGGHYKTTIKVVQRFPFNDPLGAAIGPDGRLYVSLLASGKVVRYPAGV